MGIQACLLVLQDIENIIILQVEHIVGSFTEK